MQLVAEFYEFHFYNFLVLKNLQGGLVDMANETSTFKAAGKSRASPLSMSDRLLSDNSDAVQAVSSVRRSYESELEQVLEVNSYFNKILSLSCFNICIFKRVV